MQTNFTIQGLHFWRMLFSNYTVVTIEKLMQNCSQIFTSNLGEHILGLNLCKFLFAICTHRIKVCISIDRNSILNFCFAILNPLELIVSAKETGHGKNKIINFLYLCVVATSALSEVLNSNKILLYLCFLSCVTAIKFFLVT